MVTPPISESLKRSRNVPSGSVLSSLHTYCLLMKPMISLWGQTDGTEGRTDRHVPPPSPRAPSQHPPV